MNRLKNKFLFLVLILTESTVQSQTSSIFIPRLISTNSVFELELTNYHRYHPAFHSTAQVYIKPLFMHSHNPQALARHLLPHGKSCVKLDELGNGDVNPLWFNLIASDDTTYRSTLCLHPRRILLGSLLTGYAFVAENWWLGFNTAILHSATSLGLEEKNQSAPGILAGFDNAEQAFNNPHWRAGKLVNHRQSTTGLDDIQCKLGYDFYVDDNQHDTMYLVGTIPTGNKQTSEFLFEPLVGSRSASLGFGFNADHGLSLFFDDTLHGMIDFKYRYVFSAHQTRSFDLRKNADWSRYLLMVTEDEPLNSQPGINFTTKNVKVAPGSTIDMWLAAHYHRAEFDCEIGYDFYWRQSEKVSKQLSGCSSFGVQTLALCSDCKPTASRATIAQGPIGKNATKTDATFTPVCDSDFDWNSGTHQQSVSHTLYASVGYTFECDTWSCLLGIGTAYEFAQKNALQQWSFWVTTGFSF